MKRSGFTMIELIFVIVILGILAAVAVPKLTATRTDAAVAKISSNLATVVSDAGSRWTAAGSWPSDYADLTNVTLNTDVAGGTAATTLNSGVTAALIEIANQDQANLDGNQSIVDGEVPCVSAACTTASGLLAGLTTTAASSLAAASIDPVYLATGTGATKACYELSLDYLGGITVTALTAATDVVCSAAHTATAKNNMSAAAGTAKTHAFGGSGVVY